MLFVQRKRALQEELSLQWVEGRRQRGRLKLRWEDGVMEDGVMGDGVMRDGVMGDGVMGDGVMGDGVTGDGVTGDVRKLGGEKLEEWCKE